MRKSDDCNRTIVSGVRGSLGTLQGDWLIEHCNAMASVVNFFTSTKRNVDRLIDCPCLALMRQDKTYPLYVEVDDIYIRSCPASPVYSECNLVQTTKTIAMAKLGCH
jgi:hypothetical protein